MSTGPPPKVFEITLRGSITPALQRAFDDLTVVKVGPDTVLRGALPDQAALHGVLQRVHRLGLDLVDVHECASAP